MLNMKKVLVLLVMLTITVTAVRPQTDSASINKRYEIVNQSNSWTFARSEAERLGGHLAIITNEQEQKAVELLIEEHGNKNAYWIGGYCNAKEQFVWITDEPMSYTHWAPGEPNNQNAQRQNRVAVRRIPKSDRAILGQWSIETNNAPGTGYIIEYDEDTAPSVQVTENGQEAKIEAPPKPEKPPKPPKPQKPPEPWANKWVYLGGLAGIGLAPYMYSDYVKEWPQDYRTDFTDTLTQFGGGLVVDVALLKFFSVETDFIVTNGPVKPILMVPILAKLGYRPGPVELSFNTGYTILGGFTLGGTFGFHLGPGVLFIEYFGIPKVTRQDVDSIHLFLLGYKFGLGTKNR